MLELMATNFGPSLGSYVLNQFPSIIMFGMKGFYISTSGAIQGHHGPVVYLPSVFSKDLSLIASQRCYFLAYFNICLNAVIKDLSVLPGCNKMQVPNSRNVMK